MDLEVSRVKFDREVSYLMGEGKAAVECNAWQIERCIYPVIDLMFKHQRTGRSFGFRFDCEHWDELPPSLSLFDPDNPDRLLPLQEWPQGSWSTGTHSRTNGPFLCLPGIREYHTHDSHLNDRWENLRSRDSYALRYILSRVFQKFGASNG